MIGSVGLGDVDVVVDDAAGVGDPLAADHELVFDVERWASARPPCQPASPTPLLTASSRFRSCSGLMSDMVKMWTMRSSVLSLSRSR